MAENRRGKDKRFYFSRGQLLLLGCGFTLASATIFFLGMIVGRGIEERKMVQKEEPLVKIPIKPSAQGSAAAAGIQLKEELTFYDTLTKSPRTQPLAEEKQKEAKQPEKIAKAEVKEKKLQAKDPAPAIPVKVTEKPVEKASPSARAAEKQMEKTVAQAEAPKKTESGESAENQEAGKGWTVQVNAFPDEKSAKIWVDRLKNKGYKAYVTEVLNKGKIWYRVRVGRFGSREEAETVEETLRSKENFTKAFATSR